MSRRRRQIDELRRLCGTGAVDRALDLAQQHLADFGPDDEVLALLGAAVDATDAPDALQLRYADLIGRER